MTIEAKVIAHSRPFWAEDGSSDLYTLQLRYPRCVLAELNTHRVFSRSTSSSRAVPVKKLIAEVASNPHVPKFAKNKPGMQAGEPLSFGVAWAAESYWTTASDYCIEAAYALAGLGVHKQWVNRLLETWSHVSTVVTATEWDNFFFLRDHLGAQPEMQDLAKPMREAMESSTPKVLQEGEWHLPYIRDEDCKRGEVKALALASAARCARVSYLKHDGSEPDMGTDLELADKLLTSGHMSPFEHQAVCWSRDMDVLDLPGVTHLMLKSGTVWSGNFRDWGQHRQLIDKGCPVWSKDR